MMALVPERRRLGSTMPNLMMFGQEMRLRCVEGTGRVMIVIGTHDCRVVSSMVEQEDRASKRKRKRRMMLQAQPTRRTLR